MTDKRLDKAEKLTNERLSLAEQNIAMSIERSVIEHQKMTDGRLKKEVFTLPHVFRAESERSPSCPRTARSLGQSSDGVRRLNSDSPQTVLGLSEPTLLLLLLYNFK